MQFISLIVYLLLNFITGLAVCQRCRIGTELISSLYSFEDWITLECSRKDEDMCFRMDAALTLFGIIEGEFKLMKW